MYPLSLSRPRRVSIACVGDQLVVSIKRQGNHGHHIWMVVFFTIVCAIFCRVFAPAFFGAHSAREIAYRLPFVCFILLWYVIVLRFSLWSAFGVEEVVVRRDTITCTRRILWWERAFEAPLDDVANITVKIPWHEGSGSVRFTAKERAYTIGDQILPAEANEIADELRRAISRAHA